MSEERAQELADGLFARQPTQEKSMGAMEAMGQGMVEAIGAFTKGAMDAVYSEGAQHFAEHGAHELAAALFNGSGFVMYPRGGKDDQTIDGHGVHGKEEPGQEMGMER